MEQKVSHDSETPAHGQQVITACALIHKELDGISKVFLAKRADTKKFLPGLYEMPGGHIEFGEDIIEGLKREVMEEFGMAITVGDPFFVFTYMNKVKGAQAIEVVYFAKFADSETNIRLNPEDHSRCDWIAESELQKFERHISAASESASSMIGGLGETGPELDAIKRGFEILRINSYRTA